MTIIEFDQILTVKEIVRSSKEYRLYDDSMKGMGLFGLEDEEGNDVPFMLYEWEVEQV